MHIEHPASFITGYLSHNILVMTSIAQLIKASEYSCTGRYPVQALAMFLNELSISLSLSLLPSLSYSLSSISPSWYTFVSISLSSLSLPLFSLYISFNPWIYLSFSLSKSNPSKERPEMNHMDANLGIRIRER